MVERIPHASGVGEYELEETAEHDFENEVGLFDGMSDDEKKVAEERIGEVLLNERYKDYSEENRGIFKEIENGSFSRVVELTELHPHVAHLISKKVRLISLPHITILYEDAAFFLGRHAGGLYLSGLHTLEYGVAKQLAQHNGFVDLSGLEMLSDEDAGYFASHTGELRLDGLKEISEEVLSKLATHKDDISLPQKFNKQWTISRNTIRNNNEHDYL